MAVDRFYRPGQNTYQSQYVPLKLPFQLMQQNLARKDAEIDTKFAQAQGLTDTKALGLKDFNISESDVSYYGNTEAAITQKFGKTAAEDYNRSNQAKNELDEYVSNLLDDDFIMKAASGEIADKLLTGNKMYQKLGSINTTNEARMKWRDDAEKEKAKYSDDIMSSPWLQSDYLLQLQEMEKDPTYVPSSLPTFGKSMDRSKELLSQVDILKDNSRKGESSKLTDAYKSWSSRSGRTAKEYADFAEAILDDKNSSIRRNIDAQVNSHIKLGLHKEAGLTEEEFRKQATQYEIDQLIKSSEKLQHQSVASGTTGKTAGELAADEAAIVTALLEADVDEVPGKTLTINNLDGKSKQSEANIKIYESYISKHLPNGISIEDFTKSGRDDWKTWGLTSMGGNEIEVLHQNYILEKNQKAHYDAQYAYNEKQARSDEKSGYSITEENKIKTLDYIASNPKEAESVLDFMSNYKGNLDKNTLVKLEEQAKNNPQLATLLDLKNNDPEFFQSLINEHESGGVNRAISISNITPNSFMGVKPDMPSSSGLSTGASTEYKPSKAKEFFNSIGGVPEGVDVNDQASVNNWINLNKKSNNLVNDYIKANEKKVVYENLLNQPTQTYQPGVITYPGQIINLSDVEINAMDKATDNTGTITLLNKNGNVDNTLFGDIGLLKAKYFENQRKQVGGSAIIRLDSDNYKATYNTTMGELYGDNKESLIQAFEAEFYGGETQKYDNKDIIAELTAFSNKPTSFTMKIDMSNAPSFGKQVNKKVRNANNQKAAGHTLTNADVYAEAVSNNIKQVRNLETYLGEVAGVSSGKSEYGTHSPQNIELLVPIYVDGEGYKGNNKFTVTNIIPGTTTINGTLVYGFEYTDGQGNPGEPIYAKSATEFMNLLTPVYNK